MPTTSKIKALHVAGSQPYPTGSSQEARTSDQPACACMTWARVPDALDADLPKWIPPSNHHHNCPEYKPVEWACVTYDGASCIMHPDSAMDELAESDEPEQYTVKKMMLTADQVAALPEFDGW